MAVFLVKTEPSTYSLDDLRRDRKTVWDGVSNPVALKHLATIRKGDTVVVYHTGDEKQVVGIVEIIREAYKDPTDEKGVFYCVDTRAVKPFPKPVTLATVKADAKLKSMKLAREPRLSVQPVTDDEWKLICKMGGVK